jgi:hypothetical protein
VYAVPHEEVKNIENLIFCFINFNKNETSCFKKPKGGRQVTITVKETTTERVAGEPSQSE